MKNNPSVTVLTPTYNRLNTLVNCFQSLLKQSSKDFEWLIIDDGSSDETKQIVDQFIRKADFKVSYIFKENGGKHTALNRGIKEVTTELTLVLDSDDTLTSNAIEIIVREWVNYKGNLKICGLCFLRGYDENQQIGSKFPNDYFLSNRIETENLGVTGDKIEIIRTNVLKEFPFPEISEEKFIAESVVWIRIAQKYSMVYINRIIYITEYLEGGLTRTGRILRLKYPIGALLNAKEGLSNKFKFKYRVKYSLLYIAYSLFAKRSIVKLLQNSGYPVLILLNFPFGYLLFKYWGYKFKE